MDNSGDQGHDSGRTLRTLLKQAGYTSNRVGPDRRAMVFSGRTREWYIVARAGITWLNLFTTVCALPTEPGIRMRLFDAVMAMNRKMLLTKFVVSSDSLALELDYRMDDVDGDAIDDLVSLVYSNAEEHYGKIFRIVSGDDVLEALNDPGLIPAS